MRSKVITSECVTEGHPDKLCDQISDAILDAILAKDPDAHVAVETMATNGVIIIAGEVTTTARVDYQVIAREVLRDIGYTDPVFGADAEDTAIMTAIHGQSPDIAQGVDRGDPMLQGAGDQGMMYGYATDETRELMPLPIMLARGLVWQLTRLRKDGTMPYLGPDGKSQVSVEYRDEMPVRISAVVVSAEHRDSIGIEALREEILHKVITPICGHHMDAATKVFINPTGRFVVGGPQGDTGLTGRKIMVDTYGSIGRHGGGAFSGKDPSKVDRSGAYAARWMAKNVVAAGLARRCEIQVSYAIGVAEPTSISVDTFGTGIIPDEKIEQLLPEVFDLRPYAIITGLDLKRPIYRATARIGHFGREDPEFTWERTDLAKSLRAAAGLTTTPVTRA
jgi:S-adenosylmethionine synthetase